MELLKVPQPSEYISVDGVANVRGFGGFRISASPELVTRKGRIIRSGNLDGITSTGHTQLLALGISRSFDLRNKDESVKTDFLHGEPTSHLQHSDLDMKRISVPLQSGKFSALEKLNFYKQTKNNPQIAVEAYLRIATSNEGIAALHSVLLRLLQCRDDTILIHCSLGKDRTGIIFAVLLSLVGVSDDEIGRDYGLSQRELQPTRRRLELYIQSLEPGISAEEAAMLAHEAVKADEECILRTLKSLRERYGSIREFVSTSCQWQAKDIDVLISSLVCKR